MADVVFTRAHYEAFWTHEIPDLHPTGRDQMRGPCPVHGGDSKETLLIHLDTGHAHCFKCHGNGEAWNMQDFVMARYGMSAGNARDYVRDICGLPVETVSWPYSFPPPTTLTASLKNPDWPITLLVERIHDYANWLKSETGRAWLAYALYVYEPIKSVKIRYRDAEGNKRMLWLALTIKGGWSTPKKLNLKAPPYKCLTLAGKAEVWLLNGEKAVDRAVAEWKITATCLPNGEGHWNAEYAGHFAHAEVINLVADNDDQGEEHIRVVGGALAKLGKKVRAVRLPGLPPKGDLWDWIEAGRTLEAALEVAAAAPLASASGARKAAALAATAATNGRARSPGDGLDLIYGEEFKMGMNDYSNALRMIASGGGTLRYVGELNHPWLQFNNGVWATGPVESVYPLATSTLIEMRRQALDQRLEGAQAFAERCLNSGRVEAMIKLARGLSSLPVDQLDQHPLLINCLNGTYDLETNRFREHKKEDYLTRQYPYHYDPKTPPPLLWLRTLDEWFGGGADATQNDLEHAEYMIDYVRRITGYLLTGSVDEKAFFVLHGLGNNGKTTFSGTISDMMMGYALTINASSLTRGWGRNENNVNADIARTRGARAVFASEPPEGQKFDHALIKNFTQGTNKISGAFKGHNPFEFYPTAKLMLECNRVPKFDTDDNAFMIRMHLIEFPRQFQVMGNGVTKRQELHTELSQIFHWALHGDWLHRGLGRRADEARDQLRGIRDEQARNTDGLEAFLDECFDVGPGLRCNLSEIMALHKKWRESNRAQPLMPNRLSRMLCERIGISHGNNPGDHKTPAWLKGLAPKAQFRNTNPQGGKDAQYRDDDDDDD